MKCRDRGRVNVDAVWGLCVGALLLAMCLSARTLDAYASLARRVGASAVRGLFHSTPDSWWNPIKRDQNQEYVGLDTRGIIGIVDPHQILKLSITYAPITKQERPGVSERRE
jgi:hypothetical protein